MLNIYIQIVTKKNYKIETSNDKKNTNVVYRQSAYDRHSNRFKIIN